MASPLPGLSSKTQQHRLNDTNLFIYKILFLFIKKRSRPTDIKKKKKKFVVTKGESRDRDKLGIN